ncbi:MAG: hypothetical protein AAF321_03110 [Pseudomonadota bacterium]
MDASLVDKAAREIVERHDAFVAWFTGQGDDALIETMLRCFAPSMVMIGPDGVTIPHGPLMEGLRGERGRREPEFAITVDSVEPLWTSPDTVLMTYIERQFHQGQHTARRSTTLMLRDDDAPNGVVWAHVHETWLPDGAPT